LIGTNDANAQINPNNLQRAVRRMKLPRMPSPQWYEENLRQIVGVLKRSTTARIALLSLPPIGEDLDHPGAIGARAFSKIVRTVAEQTDVAYLPLNERMTAYLEANPPRPQVRYSQSRQIMYASILQHYLLGRSFDRISTGYGFVLHTDFLHLNSTAAGMIADLIEGFIRDES